MGKESSTKSNTKSTSKQQVKLPSWINAASQNAVDLAQTQANSPVTPYTNPLVAGLSPTETASHDWLQGYNPESMLQPALAGIDASAGAPTMERLVDESGRLGSIADYFNPYVQANLNPTLAAIKSAWEEANKRTNMLATGAGRAFGDARHGILEHQNASQATEDVANATYKAYFDAWNNAMGMRGSDLGRFTQQEESFFDRQLAASKALQNAAGFDQQQQLQLLNERLKAGATERGVDQAGLTAAYGEWLRQQEEEQRRIQQLSAVTAQVPTDKTIKGKTNSTTTTTQPDNSWQGLAGSVLGAALAPMTGGASLALGAGNLFSGGSVAPTGAPAPYAGNPYSLPWLV